MENDVTSITTWDDFEECKLNGFHQVARLFLFLLFYFFILIS